MSAVQAENLTRRYGRRRALAGVTFTARPGEVVAVIGPRGAGKSTLLRVFAGAAHPSGGSALVDGHPASERAARMRTGYAPDPPLAPPELTGLEWLHYVASQHAASPAHRQVLVRFAVAFAGIDTLVTRRVGTYARDQAQRLAIGAAAMAGGSLVLLDEALTGLDPLVVRDLQGALARLATAGRVVMLASHDLAAVERLATRVLVLWRGRIIADVQTATLLGERIVELELGAAALAHAGALLMRFRGATRTGNGIAVPLTAGVTVEGLLADCRALRIAVGGSRVRYRALDDLFLAAAEQAAGAAPPAS